MHTTQRIISAAAIATIAIGGLAGCGRGEQSSSGSGDFKIAIVTRNFTNPYWAALRDGALAEGKAKGIEVNVQAGSSETDAAGENAKISTLATQGYGCFGVVPVDSSNVITPLVPIAKAGTPIINLDSQVDPDAAKQAGVTFASFIGSDNVKAGQLAGEKMLSALNNAGKVAVLQGIAGEQNGINRLNGFTQATAGKLQIVAQPPADYQQDKALSVTEALLKAQPDITGIFAENDSMGLGAAQAVKNAGLSGKIKIISVDGIRDALTAIQDGSLTATVTQYPYAEGQLAVQACQLLHDKKSVPERVPSPIALIDSANVADQIKTFPQPFQPFDNPLGS